ncbi:MAG: GIY-YIG nuclease family protein [Verrucomicrobiae bacterium]|nr:GIY-YIG nuclease family protein [Verrucomicrobiae bacterium]
MSTNEDYYVYCYIDPRNLEEFYYGKGRGNRFMAHLQDQGESGKARRIQEIVDDEGEPIIRVIAKDLTEEQALMIEATLIWKLGNRLTNINSGHYAGKFRPQNTLHKKLTGFDFSRGIHFFNVGENPKDEITRSWEDCLTHGFLSAGYGLRYMRQARQVQKGDVVLAYLSGHGYVGLGVVMAEAVPAREFRVDNKPLSKIELQYPDIIHDSDDLEKCEYVIKVKWLVAKKRDEALWKQGLFRARQTRVSLEYQPQTLRYIEQKWGINFEDILEKNEA